MYYPVLQIREDEIGALASLTSNIKESVVPIMELVGVDAKHEEFLKSFQKQWKSNYYFDVRPYYSDARRSDEHKKILLKTMLPKNIDDPCDVIPVIYLDEGEDFTYNVGALAESRKQRVCLRLTAQDLASKDDLSSRVKRFINDLKRPTKMVDLIYDYSHYVRSHDLNQMAKNFVANRNAIWAIGEFSKEILHGSCMPADMTDISIGTHVVNRFEYELWKLCQSTSTGKSLHFSDRTVMYPKMPLVYEKGQFVNMTASVKYTTNDSIRIYRGGVLFKGKHGGHQQYTAHAKSIVSDNTVFSGSDYCEGDEKIFTYSQEVVGKKGKVGTGSPNSWRRASMNHHMTLVALQLE
ncbi:MAG: hypothetical protein JSS89_11995 [Bacteroidetes bacterium]|nr:hypothetical protein [Bacteroidota bacterium]